MTFKYDKLCKHFLHKCDSTECLTILNWAVACTAQGVSPDAFPAGVLLRKMPEVVTVLAIPNQVSMAPAQATEEILIAKAENTIDMKMDNIIKAFQAWNWQQSKVNDPRYGCYQTAMVYSIYADHLPPHTALKFPPLNSPTWPDYYRSQHNYEPFPPHGSGPGDYCDALGHMHTFSPNVRTDQENGIVYLNDG